jgi:hypothetical protein
MKNKLLVVMFLVSIILIGIYMVSAKSCLLIA